MVWNNAVADGAEAGPGGRSSDVTILGVRFFGGGLPRLLKELPKGGLLVAPSAPGMQLVGQDRAYTRALLEADWVLADSGYLTTIWSWLGGAPVERISGLRFLRALLEEPGFRASRVFWVMPDSAQAAAHRHWAWQSKGWLVAADDCYVAPAYRPEVVEDAPLAAILEEKQPAYIVICIGGGVQEPLGNYLRQRLAYRPAIICTGAAVAFLNGQQVHIPPLVDLLRLGWLWRSLANPRRFIPRFWKALPLAWRLWKYGANRPGA